MKKFYHLPIIALFAATIASCSMAEPNAYNIIPLPQEMTPQEGKFKLTEQTELSIPANNPEFKHVAEFFAQRLEVASGMKLTISDVANPTKTTNLILFKQPTDTTLLGKEGYTLSVTPDHITIEAATGNGAFYAIQSLIQLLPPQILASERQRATWTVPCVEIKDKPRYAYRGMHLDVARHFYPVEVVKQYIDMIALHKMNTFHWHLTDDQGWRIEIKKHPKLTEIGSKRKETLIGSYYDEYPQVFDGKEHGGFYTQEQIKEVVEYAAQRYVTIIPEIEMPGHALAALAAYPELSCTGGTFEVACKWGIFKDVFCPKEETFAFLEDVLSEVIELFPSQYIHVGGDECPKDRWKECKYCQALMKKEKLKDEHELQSYFVQRIEKFVNAKGRRIIGWDEILEGGLAPDATVMSWQGTRGGIAAAQQKHYVVMSPMAYCYLNFYGYDPYLEPVTIGNFLPLSKVYGYDPTPEELTPEEQQYILGVQGNMWVEYASSAADVWYQVLPSSLAIAEVGWTDKPRKDFYGFTHRVKEHLKFLDVYGVNYSKTMFDVLAIPAYNADSALLTVALRGEYDSTAVRYTVDGSMPTANSLAYSKPIEIKGRVTIKSGAFEKGKLLGRIFEREYVGHKAIGAGCTLENGTEVLAPVNGLRASVYDNPGWYSKGTSSTIRVDSTDMVFTVDLKTAQPISKVTACLINQPLYRVVVPSEMQLAYSADGQSYTDLPAKAIENKEPNRRRNVEGVQELKDVQARYLKVRLKNAGSPFPVGSTNEGKPSVILLDELIVE